MYHILLGSFAFRLVGSFIEMPLTWIGVAADNLQTSALSTIPDKIVLSYQGESDC